MTPPALVLAAILAVAYALEPGWTLRALELPRWVAGFWRTWLPGLAFALWLVVLLANELAPGAAARAASRAGRALMTWLPAIAAAGTALLSLIFTAGAATAGALARSAVIFGLQLGLFPATPVVLALAASGVIVIGLDRRGVRVLPRFAAWWLRLSPSVVRTLAQFAPPLLAAVFASTFAAALFPDAMRGWTRPDPVNAQAYHLYRSFFNYSIYEDDRLERQNGFKLGLRGLTLPPGEAGEVVFRLERPSNSIVLLRTDFYNRRLAESGTSLTEDTFPNRLELSSGGEFVTLLQDTSLGEILGGSVLNLTSTLGDARTYRLRFSARNTTSGEVTVLPAFSVSTVVDPETVPHPVFPVVAYAALAAGAVCATARPGVRSGTAVAAGSAAGCAIALAACLASRIFPGDGGASAPPLDSLVFNPANPPDVELALRAARALTTALGALLLAWVTGARLRLNAGIPSEVVLLGVSCALVTVVAIDARWQELMRVRYELLLPDAAGYQAIAAEFPIKMARYRSERPSDLLEALYESGFDGRASAAAVFYAGGNNGREPGWPALLRLTFNLLGVSAFHTRLTSLVIASACAGLTCWFGWRSLHPLAALTGGLLYAVNYPQIVNSVGGLREEAVALCFLILLGALFVDRRSSGPSITRLGIAGVAGAYLILIRADMLVLVGLVITIAAIALRWRPREWLIACATCALLAGPMYVGYAFTHRDPFYPGTYGATVNRNLEFPERMGTPGFPTAEEYAANWAAGPRISPMTYFFGYHSVPQFVQYSVSGFIRIFPTILFRDQAVQLWLFVAGMALLLASRRWLVPSIVVISLAPFYAFMAGVPNPWVFAPRYAHHALPFAVLAAAYAAWAVPSWLLRQRLGRRTPLEANPESVHVSDLRTALP